MVPRPPARTPHPRIILDCDPGTDDAIALLLAFAAPEIDLAAITVAGGNVGLDHTLRNALALTRLAGADVPVYRGADRPLLGRFVSAHYVHGEDGMGGVGLPPGGAAGPRPRRRRHPRPAARRRRADHAGRHRAGHQSRRSR